MKTLVFINVKTNKEELIPVTALFWNAVIPMGNNFPFGVGHGNCPDLTGINVGIAIPHSHHEEYIEFRDKLAFLTGFSVFLLN